MPDLSRYFVADNAHDERTIWRELEGGQPVPAFTRWDMRHCPELWDVLVQAIEKDDQEPPPPPKYEPLPDPVIPD